MQARSKTWTKLVSCITALCMLLTLVGYVPGVVPEAKAGDPAATAPCTGDHTGWTEIDSWATLKSLSTEQNDGTFDYYLLPAGSYYLSADVLTDCSVGFVGTVNLCLNGHTLRGTNTKNTAIKGYHNNIIFGPTGSGSVFNLCDHTGNGHIRGNLTSEDTLYVESADKRAYIVYVDTGTTFNFFSGNMDGCRGRYGVIYISGTGAEMNMYDGAKIYSNWGQSTAGAIYLAAQGTLNMYGGQIYGNLNGNGAVHLAANSTFNMYDGQIRNHSKIRGVTSGGSFNMYGGTISGNTSDGSTGGGVAVTAGTTTMSGGTISGNTAGSNGGGVYITGGGTFNMSGGVIKTNTATTTGGGVQVYNGTFNMSGTAVIGGSAAADKNLGTNGGGGVYVNSSSSTAYGTFNMTGGTIGYNNTTNGGGGGVYVTGYGKFTMDDGAITNNTTTGTSSTSFPGGGVYVTGANTRFTMNGGSITGNSCSGSSSSGKNGGGVAAYTGTLFTMTGGTISGNSANNGHDVMVMSNNTTLNMSGGTIGANNAAVRLVIYSDSSSARPVLNISGGTVAANIGSASSTKGVAELNITGGRVKGFGGNRNYGSATISGGVFGVDPSTLSGLTIATGKIVAANTGDDSATYPYIVRDPIAVTGVTLDQHEASITMDETVTLTAAVAPPAADDATVSWSSSDESVATVADGVVTPVGAGTATITVTTNDGGFTDTCTVTVTSAPTTVTATADPYAYNSGDTVDVVLDLSHNRGLLGAKVVVTYDPALTLTGVSGGTALTGLTFVPGGDLTANPFVLLWTGMDSVTGEGTMATLSFTVAENTPIGDYPVTLSCEDDDFFDNDYNDVPVLLNSCSVTVERAAGGDVITLEDDTTVVGNTITTGNFVYTLPTAGQNKILDLNGHTLTAADLAAENTITVNGSLTIRDSSAAGDGRTVGYRFWVPAEQSLTLESGAISDSNTTTSGGAGASVAGTFLMSGGKITNCHSVSTGGGVVVIGGTVSMTGGEISECTSADKGGGVYITSGGTFNMSGGVIRDNSTTGATGGGVNVSAGTFNMSGTALIGGTTSADKNTASNSGGGVAVVSNSSTAYGVFNMTGGTITGNSVANSSGHNGGGVYINGYGRATISGGTISSNTAGNGNEIMCMMCSGNDYVGLTMTGGTVGANNASRQAISFYTSSATNYASGVISGGDITGYLQASGTESSLSVQITGSVRMRGINSLSTSRKGITITGGVYGQNVYDGGLSEELGDGYEIFSTGNADYPYGVGPAVNQQANMTLSDDLTFRAYFNSADSAWTFTNSDLTTSVKAPATADVTVGERSYVDLPVSTAGTSDEYYVVAIPVHAKEMGDEIAITLKTSGGDVIRVQKDSVKDYAKRIIDSSDDAGEQALMADMLNYGAAAQTYFGYKTGALANVVTLTSGELSDYESALPTLSDSGNTIHSRAFHSSNLTLEEKIDFSLYFWVNQISSSDTSYQLSVNGGTPYAGTFDTYLGGTSGDQILYEVKVDDLTVAQMKDAVITVNYTDVTGAPQTAQDTLAGYLARNEGLTLTAAPHTYAQTGEQLGNSAAAGADTSNLYAYLAAFAQSAAAYGSTGNQA